MTMTTWPSYAAMNATRTLDPQQRGSAPWQRTLLTSTFPLCAEMPLVVVQPSA